MVIDSTGVELAIASTSKSEHQAAFWQRRFAGPDAVESIVRSNLTDIDVVRYEFGGVFLHELDDLNDQILGGHDWGTSQVTLVTTGSAVGWLMWSLRGGYLAASLITTVSPWLMLDPLPLFDNGSSKKERVRSATSNDGTRDKETKSNQPLQQRSDQLEQMMDQ